MRHSIYNVTRTFFRARHKNARLLEPATAIRLNEYASTIGEKIKKSILFAGPPKIRHNRKHFFSYFLFFLFFIFINVSIQTFPIEV